MFEIGNTLREARLRRGLDITDCENATKIRSKYLRALEEEQFEVLPGPTYVRGFLRTYAEYLELDGRLVLDEYESRFERRGELGADEVARRSRSRRRSRESRVLAIASTVVMLASVGLWVGFAHESKRAAPVPLDAVITAIGRQPTYVEARELGPDGRQLFTPGPIAPTKVQRLVAAPPIWVAVGDGPGITLTVDGTEVTVPNSPANFLIGAGGVIQSAP